MSDTLYFENLKAVSDTIKQGGAIREIGSTPISRTLADINGDGRLDFVYCPGDWPTGEILTFPYLWLQGADGSFTDSVVDPTPALSFPGQVFVKDFNNDGLMDIYVGTLGNELKIPEESTPDVLYLQQRDGSFKIDDRVELPKNWAHGTSVGDLNDDGWMDVFSTGGTGDGTYIYWGSKDGFTVELTELTGDPSYFPPYYRDVIHRSRIQDFDGDGRSDLLIGASGWNNPIAPGEEVPIFPSEIIFAYGRPDERRVALPIPEVPWMDPWAYEITNSQIGDLDGDGDMDLVISFLNNGGFVYEGDFYPSWDAEKFGITVDPRESNRIIQILRNDGDRYTDVSDHTQGLTLRGRTPPFEVNILDFNADGHLDIYLDPSFDDAAFIMLGDGKFGFHEPGVVGIDYGPAGDAADLNGDGIADLIGAWQDYNGTTVGSYMVAHYGIGEHAIWYGTSNDDAVRLRLQQKAYAGVGDDQIVGSLKADAIWGGWNNDTLFGRKGRDKLFGEHGKDNLDGGIGHDVLIGGSQDDLLFGGRDDDILRGGSGRDRLKGENGSDTLNGGAGHDKLFAGKGRDVLIGGKGSDDFIFASKNGRNVIRDFDANNNAEDIKLTQVNGIRGFKDLQANHMSQVGDDVVIGNFARTVIILRDVDIADLGRGDFIF